VHYAAQNGYQDIIAILQAMGGIDLDATDSNGFTALHYASRNDHYGIVKHLADCGSNINVRSKSSKQTPVHEAVVGGHKRIVKELLKRPVTKIHTQNSEGNTPLHLAVLHDWPDVVEVIAEHCSAIAAPDPAIVTFYKAILSSGGSGQQFPVSMLESRAPVGVDILNNTGQTPLSIAAMLGSLACTSILIEQGGNISIADNKKLTPLHWAALKGHTKIIAKLLSTGAKQDINKPDFYGCIPLHYACMNGDQEMIALLLTVGAEVEAEAQYEMEPLD
jgi:ankyrin repeat protein